MGQEQDHSREQAPLVFSGADELIDYRLGDVDEITKLRFPQHKRLGVVAAVAILKAEHAGFRQRGVVDFATGLIRRNMLEWHVFLLVFYVEQNRMALIESAATGVLAAEPDWDSGLGETPRASASAIP